MGFSAAISTASNPISAIFENIKGIDSVLNGEVQSQVETPNFTFNAIYTFDILNAVREIPPANKSLSF